VAGLDQHLYEYAARGFVVWAPDYGGLGVENEMHYYLVKEPTALSVWDGAYAAKALVESLGGSLADDGSGVKTVLLGHSQGGQAVLFAHQYWENDGEETHLAGIHDAFELLQVVPVAPAPQWIKALAIGSQLYDSDDKRPAYILAASYVHAAATYYGLNESQMLSDDTITAVEGWYETQCQTELVATLTSDSPAISSQDASVVFNTTVAGATGVPTGAADISAGGAACMAAYLTGSSFDAGDCVQVGTTTAPANATAALGYAYGYYAAEIAVLDGLGDSWGTRLNLDGTGTALSGSYKAYIPKVPTLIVHGLDDTLVPYTMSALLLVDFGYTLAVAAATDDPAAAGAVMPDSDFVVGADHTGAIESFSEYVGTIFDAAGL